MALRGNLRQVLKQAAVLVVGGGLGIAAVWLWPRHLSAFWLPLALLVASALGVVVHELGHILMGLTVRFKPVLLIAGPVRIRRTPGGWRIDTGRLGFIGGAAVSVPKDDRELPRRLRRFLLGGASANLVSALIALPFASASDLAGLFAGVFAAVNLLFVWMALYPAAMAGVRTDGSRLVMLRQGAPEADRWVASFWIIALSFLGHRPRSWPEDWVRRATGYEDISPDDFQSAMIAYARALDEGDLARARAALNRAGRSLHVTALIAKPEYHIEAAFLAALDGDVLEADSHLTSVNGTLIRKASLARARAAREWSAGNAPEAARRAREGIEAVHQDWDAGMAEVDLHWLNRFAA